MAEIVKIWNSQTQWKGHLPPSTCLETFVRAKVLVATKSNLLVFAPCAPRGAKIEPGAKFAQFAD